MLQLLELLQDLLGACTRREERIRRHGERRLEIERPGEVRYALGGALEEATASSSDPMQTISRIVNAQPRSSAACRVPS